MTIDEFADSWKIAHISPILKVHSPIPHLTNLCFPSIVTVIWKSSLSQSLLLFDRTQSSS